MTTPPPLPTVPVAATYRDASGQPLTGTVSITASIVVRHAPSGSVVHPTPVVLTLDATGSFTTALMPTDHPDVLPKQWEYRVDESIGPDLEHPSTASYTLRVPHDAEVVDLSRIQP